jgi:plastocyanin domain-containing protein
MRIALFAFLLALSCKQQAPAPAQSAPAQPLPPGVTLVTVTERGFNPERIQAGAGEQVTLRFLRTVESTCANAVQIEGDPVKHALPVNVPVDVKVSAPKSGQLAFACPMNMFTGSIVVVAR